MRFPLVGPDVRSKTELFSIASPYRRRFLRREAERQEAARRIPPARTAKTEGMLAQAVVSEWLGSRQRPTTGTWTARERPPLYSERAFAFVNARARLLRRRAMTTRSTVSCHKCNRIAIGQRLRFFWRF